MRKFLFVGLGGSGGKTLRYLRHDLTRWLDQINWKGGFPAGWQLIQIDTPSEQDGKEITEVPMLPAENYVGLVGSGITFDNVSTRLTNGARASRGWQDLATWRVNPTFLNVPIETGAGQYRAVGRAIGLAYAERIRDAINTAQRALMQADAGAQLTEISKVAGNETGSPTNPNPVVVIVSSLAGGSGAGLLMDTCDIIRQIGGSWGDESFGILYTADVFKQIGQGTAGVQPNTLAAISEVLNGHWLTATSEQEGGRINPMLSAAGNARPIERSGPKYPFLVGASNTKGVTFGDQQSVYKMMGRALRSWTTDEGVQDELIGYTITNWDTQAKDNMVDADVLLRDHEPVFEAYGFCEVNLGTDRFQQYSAERLARSAADWLHEGHLKYLEQVDPARNARADTIVDELASKRLLTFLNQAGLNEQGPENNDLIDAIDPRDTRNSYWSAVANLTEQVRLDVPSRGLNSETWIQQIESFLPGFADQFIQDAEMEMRKVRVVEWAASQAEKTIAATNDLVAAYGLAVAKRTLEMAIDVSTTTVNELYREAAEDWDTGPARYSSSMVSRLNVSGRIQPGHMAVTDAIEIGFQERALHPIEAKRRRVGADVLRDFTKNFLTPLKRALDFADGELDRKGYLGDGITPAIVTPWPLDAVPERLVPPKNECLVISHEDFRPQFDLLLERSVEEGGADDAMLAARTELITGSFLNEEDLKSGLVCVPVKMNQTWRLDPSLVLGAIGTATAATFEIGLSAGDLLDRANCWLRKQGNPFARVLNADLRSYLSDQGGIDPDELAKRQANFRTALKSAIDSAEPLVEIDTGLRELLHPRGSDRPKAKVGKIPLKDHPLEQEVRSILSSALGGGTAEYSRYLTADTNVRSIPISSTLGNAHDPLIFHSINDPIISTWARVAGAQAAGNFWLNRRARPLTEFVPVSQQLLVTMVRGWFTGLLLGRIDRESLTIVRERGVQVGFPNPLLSRVDRDSRDLLPAILESLGLAYIEVAQMRELSRTGSLNAYIELRDLGVKRGVANFRKSADYPSLNDDLRKWVGTGTFAVEPIATPILDSTGATQSSTPQERQTLAADLLDRTRDVYVEDYKKYEDEIAERSERLGPDGELWPGLYVPIETALRQLAEAFRKNSSGPVGPM